MLVIVNKNVTVNKEIRNELTVRHSLGVDSIRKDEGIRYVDNWIKVVARSGYGNVVRNGKRGEEEERMPQLEVEYIMNTISWIDIVIIVNLIIVSKVVLPSYIKTQESLIYIS